MDEVFLKEVIQESKKILHQIEEGELDLEGIKGLLKLGIIGHINWKIDFISSLTRGEVPQVERDPRRCLLGLSMELLKENLKGTKGEAILNALEEPHKRLHGLVERVEREVDLNDKSSIMNFIEREVLPTFEEVMKGLLALKEYCESLEG